MPEVAGVPASPAVLAALLYGLVSGFNDGGSLLASFTSGRVISPRLAVLLLVFVPLGPLAIGTEVARTVGVSVVDLAGQRELGFAAIVVVSLAVVLVSWQARIPTSMTLALVGAMLGWAGAERGTVHWPGVWRVLAGMPVSVVLGAFLAWSLHRLVRALLGGFAHRHLLLVARLQVASAGLQAFSYGANDMAKTIGLLAVARVLDQPGGPLSFADGFALGGAYASFLLGTVAGGWGLAYRTGFGVARMRPVQAMTAQTGAGLAVGALALAGAPVSTTQTIYGSLVGAGAAVRASAIRWGLLRSMLASWLVTLPLALLASAAARLLLGALGVVR